MRRGIMTENKKAYHDERLGWIMKEGLTPKQKTVYDVIKDFIKSNEYSPSYEEIKQLAGLHSKENVHRYIYQLIDRGWLRNKKGRNRSLSLT